MCLLLAVLCAIRLVGVEGNEIRARAFFDANNVKVGDPMVLTVDFIGEAEFKDLHPPALSRAVSRRDWKLDDASAKTDTFRDARRLTYRVRPMRAGVLWFPSLEFEYAGPDGSVRRVRSNDIPVHAKGGEQVVVEEMGEDRQAMPAPPELMAADRSLTEDEDFAWRRAMAHPTADAFAAFDFPAARMNEATCALREGNWSRAQKIYSALEWRTGQTPEIERGLVAALALRHENPSVELPVWRQVLRPLLRFGWAGRVGIVLGGFAALALLFWLLGRGIRAVACLALTALLAVPANGQGIFQQMEERMNRMREEMRQAFGSVQFGPGQGTREVREPVRITAKLAASTTQPQVGSPFEFIVALDAPRTVTIDQVRLSPTEPFALTYVGQVQNLKDGRSDNPSNVVRRLSIPVRYDVPYRGRQTFVIEGMVTGSQTMRGGAFSFTFSNSFRCETNPIALEVRPLPTENQPANYGGIVSEGLRLHELCDILRVETNDVVTITYRMYPKGYVPDAFLPEGAAFEWVRQNDAEGRLTEIEYRRYLVADGISRTPELTVPYYDPRTQTYKTVKTGGTPLSYRASASEDSGSKGSASP